MSRRARSSASSPRQQRARRRCSCAPAGLMRPDRGVVVVVRRAAASRLLAARPDGIAFAGDRPFPYGFLTIREARRIRGHRSRSSAARQRASESTMRSSALASAPISHRRVDSLDGERARAPRDRRVRCSRVRVSCSSMISLPAVMRDTAAELLAVLRRVARDGTGVVIAGRFASSLSRSGPGSRRQRDCFTLVAGDSSRRRSVPDIAARRAASRQ